MPKVVRKKCNACADMLAVSQFYRRGCRKDGSAQFSTNCKRCHRIQCKRTNAKRRARVSLDNTNNVDSIFDTLDAINKVSEPLKGSHLAKVVARIATALIKEFKLQMNDELTRRPTDIETMRTLMNVFISKLLELEAGNKEDKTRVKTAIKMTKKRAKDYEDGISISSGSISKLIRGRSSGGKK